MISIKYNVDNIIISLKYLKNSIELVYTDNYKICCYFILIDFIVDYKEQILIIGIKTNI